MDEVKNRILDICSKMRGCDNILAALIYGLRTDKDSSVKDELNVLVIIKSKRPIMKIQREKSKIPTLLLLIVDEGTFRRDIDEGWLGELLTENLIIPHTPIINEEYIRTQEVRAKKRIITELINSLILEYPELSYNLHIKPEYFLCEIIGQISSIFPPIRYIFRRILHRDSNGKYIRFIMESIKKALEEMINEKIVYIDNGYIRISREYIDKVKLKNLNLIGVLRRLRRSVLNNIFKVFPPTIMTMLMDQGIYAELSSSIKNVFSEPSLRIEDSKRFLFLPTPLGLVSMSDQITIHDLAKKILKRNLRINLKRIGGVLNSVYQLTFKDRKSEKKIIIKLFRDWYGLKWFPLLLWTLGTRKFSVLGRSRLEREYSINRFLHDNGVPVPRIYYVSPKSKIISEEYIEGEGLIKIIKNLSSEKDDERFRAAIRDAGKTLARIHGLNVAVGDCKPENIIVGRDGKIYFLDLEQSSRNGDRSWDIAEFLYYTGHYFLSPSSLNNAKLITREFINGYLDGGGEAEVVRRACSTRYIKVFSFFTPPHIIFMILSTIKKILKEREAT